MKNTFLLGLFLLAATFPANLLAQDSEWMGAWLFTENGDSIWLPGEIVEPEEVWRSSDGLPFYGQSLDVERQVYPATTHARIGAYCVDGAFSQSLKNGTCSGHGGVRWWFYQHRDSLGREDAQVVLVPGPKFQPKRPSSSMPGYGPPPSGGGNRGNVPPNQPPPNADGYGPNQQQPFGQQGGQATFFTEFAFVFRVLVVVLAFVVVLLIIKKLF